MRAAAAYLVATTTLIALILLCLAWEAWLAPLRAGSSLLILKSVPLLLPLFGILHGRRYTYQWAPLLALVYLAEGMVRGWSDPGLSAVLGWVEAALAAGFVVSAGLYARWAPR